MCVCLLVRCCDAESKEEMQNKNEKTQRGEKMRWQRRCTGRRADKRASVRASVKSKEEENGGFIRRTAQNGRRETKGGEEENELERERCSELQLLVLVCLLCISPAVSVMDRPISKANSADGLAAPR